MRLICALIDGKEWFSAKIIAKASFVYVIRTVYIIENFFMHDWRSRNEIDRKKCAWNGGKKTSGRFQLCLATIYVALPSSFRMPDDSRWIRSATKTLKEDYRKPCVLRERSKIRRFTNRDATCASQCVSIVVWIVAGKKERMQSKEL